MAEGKFISVSSILKDYGLKIINALKKNLEQHTASHVLQQSIDFSVAIFGNVYTMSIQMEDYWRYVEYGRRAGKFPPPESIFKWTTAKGFSINETARSFGIKGKINRESVRRQLAFLIGRKIAKFGIPATHFASKVLGQDFIQSGALTAPIWVNLRNDLEATIGKQVTIEVINFKR